MACTATSRRAVAKVDENPRLVGRLAQRLRPSRRLDNPLRRRPSFGLLSTRSPVRLPAALYVTFSSSSLAARCSVAMSFLVAASFAANYPPQMSATRLAMAAFVCTVLVVVDSLCADPRDGWCHGITRMGRDTSRLYVGERGKHPFMHSVRGRMRPSTTRTWRGNYPTPPLWTCRWREKFLPRHDHHDPVVLHLIIHA
jgi:hypothetical protein